MIDVTKLVYFNEYMKERMTVDYPSRNDYIIVYAYLKGKIVFKGTQTEWSEVFKDVEHSTVEKDKDTKRPEYDSLVKEYDTQRNIAYEEWKKDLFEYADADMNNEKHAKLYDKIYDDYHSCMSDVVYKFEEYMDILR